jgi:hypothetical protein
MGKQVYWLSDAEWRRIEPLLSRGRKGRIGSMINARSVGSSICGGGSGLILYALTGSTGIH